MHLLWLLTHLAVADTPQDVMKQTLDEAMQALAEQPHPPYYVAVTVQDVQTVTIDARAGVLYGVHEDEGRTLDVDLRVGSPELDSTHPLRGFSSLDGEDRDRLRLPLDDGYPLRHALWRELDRAYRGAAERIQVVRANQQVLVEEEDPAPDFEKRAPVIDALDTAPLQVDLEEYKALLKDLSSKLDDSPVVHRSQVTLSAERKVTRMVDSDGTSLVHGRTHGRLSFILTTTADDGDEVQVFKAVDVHDLGSLPDPDTLGTWTEQAVQRLEALREAPRGEPYSGPVILLGQATGVFFHEVMGHRVEGHRQKRESEGKTFAEYVGKPILPEFIDVYDDPTIEKLAGADLNGHYVYDDEGVEAQRAVLVEDGKFQGFLMSRSPLDGFPHSNGHGRRSTGNPPLARMGNTIIESERTVPFETLRKQLLQEIQDQDLEYGYIVEAIDGGFTLTGRVTPNAFNVRASASWRVYADGRPDELVRGIDLVGTPLVAFGNLVATDDQPQVFNGVCGAESGWVPVSAVAPSVLFKKLEFQLKEKGQDRPPLLAKPESRDGSAMAPETDDAASTGGAR